MKYKWLNKQRNSNLIIFFNGWGMDECVVQHLDFENHDVLMLYDYNNLDTDFDFNSLSTYSEKNLVAWSMGVMVATNFNINYKAKIAINGTLYPINENYGIHPRIYDLTIKGFNEKGRERFIKSMFNDSSDSKNNVEPNDRTLVEQRSELVALKSYNANTEFKYDKIFISDNDKIIPTKSQISYWDIEPNLKSGHCPFLLFKKWSELL